MYPVSPITYPDQDLKPYVTPERYPLVVLAAFLADADL